MSKPANYVGVPIELYGQLITTLRMLDARPLVDGLQAQAIPLNIEQNALQKGAPNVAPPSPAPKKKAPRKRTSKKR